jgi:hypothetical protein
MADEDEARIQAEREAHLQQRFPVLEFFQSGHLPERLRAVSSAFRGLAYDMVSELGGSARPAEVAAGLRKLLEAKDCFVRSGLP